MQNGFIKTFDGTKLYYSIDGQGPPLLFCYGIVCSKQHWMYQMEYFKKKKYTCIWFDYRGHHNSEIPKNTEDLTLANIARDAEFLLDELNIQSVSALGHSMGVNVVLELYRRSPQRIKSMVLANGSARAPLETLLGTNIVQFIFPYIYKFYKQYPSIANLLWATQGKSKIAPWIVGQLGFNPNLAKEEDIQTYVQMLSKLDMIVLLQLLKDYDNYDATSWLHKVHVPTLIIAGENDLVIPRKAQEIMHQLIPNSKYELIRNGSHCPQMDIPELLNIIIERFLSENYSLEPSESTTSFAQRPLQGEIS